MSWTIFDRKFKVEHRVASKFPIETSEYVEHAKELGRVSLASSLRGVGFLLRSC